MTALEPRLQSCIDRYGRALQNPNHLLSLHPRGKGRPKKSYSALCAPVVLTTVSAFEGFAEDFLATALYLRGQTFAQIAQRADMNNPTLRDWLKTCQRDFNTINHKAGADFSLSLYKAPSPDATNGWWNGTKLTWSETLDAAESWMQVRHCLTHGLVTGLEPEVWPGTKTGGLNPARNVLRERKAGLFSLGLHGAINCARTYVRGAQAIATAIAEEMNEDTNWSSVPDFQDQDAVRNATRTRSA